MALDQRVDEEAALEVVAVEPLGEDVEDGKQAFLGRAGALLDRGDEPAFGPELLAPVEDGERELVLRSEVPVERHLGDACIGDDPIDPDRVQPEAREQPVRRLEESLVRQGCLVGRRHALIGSMRQTCLYRTST